MYIVVSGIESSGQFIQIQFSSGYIIPEYIIDDIIKDFHTWDYSVDNRIFIWENVDNNKLSILINNDKIAWISTQILGFDYEDNANRYRIPGQSSVCIISESTDLPPPI